MPVTINGTTGITNPDGSAGTPSLVGTDSNTGIFFPAADTIAFAEGGAEGMRIDSAGNVGIGTSSPLAKLNVAAGAIRLSDSFELGFGANTSFIAGNSASNFVVVFTSNTERFKIDSAGALILAGSTAQKATGTTWSNPSDERLKDNIRDYDKGLAELMQVRVREWEYNGKGGTVDGTKGLGVVADEIMIVLPDTVENYEAKLNAADEEVTAIKKFDATEITWLLVKAIQELKAIVDAQAARITALEGTP